MRWVLMVAGVVVLLVLAVVVIGLLLPQAHVASVARSYPATPDQVWAALTNVESFAAWRPDLNAAERVPSADGKVRWKEKTRFDSMTIEVVEAVAPKKLVTRIADEGLPFGGSWTYEIMPETSSTRLTITERGEVYNPIFRFVARFIMGHTATMEKYHAGLARRLGGKSPPDRVD